MNPNPIPLDMLKVNVIAVMVRNAGKASSKLFHSILFIIEIIKKPTIIRAGAIAAAGMKYAKGTNNIPIRNRQETTIEVKPVLPPSLTPAELST